MSVNYHAYQSRGVPFAEYEVVSEQWRQTFIGYDPKRIAEILRLHYDEEYLYLSYFQRPYRLRRADGHLEKCRERKQEQHPEKHMGDRRQGRIRSAEALCGEREDGGTRQEWTEDLYFNESMAIYHLLHYTKDAPVVAGVWVPSHAVDGVVSRNPRAVDPLLDSFCRSWTGHTEELKEACRRHGGVEFFKGDAAFTFEAFSCLKLQIIFWDADEDFPAQLQVLVDRCVTDFVHYETVGCITSDLLEMLGN